MKLFKKKPKPKREIVADSSSKEIDFIGGMDVTSGYKYRDNIRNFFKVLSENMDGIVVLETEYRYTSQFEIGFENEEVKNICRAGVSIVCGTDWMENSD